MFQDKIAKIIYEAMTWAANEGPPESGVIPGWMQDGNSDAQSIARGAAFEVAEAYAGPKPVEMIELRILELLDERTPSEYDLWYFKFSFIMTHCGLDREVVGGFMRSMRNRGLVEYGAGFDEDGMTTGGGYAITRKGRNHLKGAE